MLGKVIINVEYEQQAAKVPLVIVKGNRPAQLGRNWLNKFRLNWKEILQVKAVGNTDPDVAVILHRHKEVFEEGPSTIHEFKALIKMRPDVQPIFKKVNPVSYALGRQINTDLWKLKSEHKSVCESGNLSIAQY